MPVISTSYDTFTVATMINRAIYDQLIKKEILLVEDILIPLEKTEVLKVGNTVERWTELNKATKHSRFPVVDDNLRLQGMVTSRDILGVDATVQIDKVMTKNPISVGEKTSVASAAHMMVWEGIELLPVVDSRNLLIGIITRQDVLKALQMSQRQPQVGDTIDDVIANQMTAVQGEDSYHCEVTPQMTNHLGTISYGVFTAMVIEATNRVLRGYKRGDLVVENITVYFLKPVQLESRLEIIPKVLEIGRKFGKVDIEVFNDGKLVGKAMMTCQLLERS